MFGTVHPAKGTELGIRAFTTAALSGNGRERLVVAGGKFGPESEDGLRDLVDQGRATRLGPVSDVLRDELLTVSDVALCPSMYEGFGLVPLEALARGTPAVVSDAHPSLEVVPSWPLVFRSGVESECAETLAAAIAGDWGPAITSARHEMRAWDWHAYARELGRIYMETP